MGAYVVNGSNGWTSGSDITLKDIISEILNPLDKINTLRAIKYTWKSDKTKKINIGVVAQEVQAVLPEAVHKGPTETLGVTYTDLIPLLIGAVKELKIENETLKNRLNNAGIL